MILRLVSSTSKDSNESGIGKRLKIALFLCLLCTGVVADKKHRKELPIPKKEKEVFPTTAVGTEDRLAPRPKTGGGSAPTSEKATDKALVPLSSKEDVASSQCTEKYPIETFMQIASASSPQASIRGGVFFISDLREAPQIYSLETPGGWPEQLTFFPDGVRYYSLSPDGQKMLIASDSGGDEQYDIHLFHVKTKKQTPILVGRNKRIESVQWDPTSNWFAYTSTERNQKDFDLYRYDLGTQKSSLLATLEGHHSLTDISQNGNLIAIQEYRSVIDSDVLIFDQKQKKMFNVTSHLKAYSADGIFTRSGDSLFFISDYSGGMPQVFQLPLNDKQGNTPKQITSGKWGIENHKMNREKDALIYQINEEGYSRLAGFEVDARGSRKQSLTLPDTAKDVVGGFSFAETYGKNGLFFTKSSSKRTSDVWLWKRGNANQWTQSTLGLMNPKCFQEERLIRYPSFDGEEIPAFVYLPRGINFDSPSHVPFIVYVHGGPEAQYRPTFSKTFQYLLQRGFGVMALNIRGSTGYGKEYTLKDNYKKRMDSIQDIVEGTKWLIKNQFTRSKLLAIYGGSYGGFAVLRTIQVEPALFAAASESVGISNFVTFLKNTKAYRRALREVEYGPLSDTEFLKSISPIEHVEVMKTPLLIFHGANDPRVPVNETEQMVEALKKRDVPVDFVVFKDEGHGNKKLSNILAQAKQMAFFFEKYVVDEKK